LLATGGALAFNTLWKRNFVDQVAFELLNQIRWESSDLIQAIVIVFVIGAITGAVGSGFAVGRFLRV
jgi:cell division protein FtsX